LESDGIFTIPSNFSLIKAFKACVIAEQEWFGFVIANDQYVYVAFRGTKTELDWLADFKFDQEIFPFADGCGSVHSGFLSIYRSCREELLSIVKELALGRKIFITGHSLGGTLATLFGFELAISGICTPNIYTFGSPKVGNSLFKQKYEENVRQSIRFVNLYDMVPLAPPFKIEVKPLNIYLEYVQVHHAITFAKNNGTVQKSHHINTYIEGVEKMKKDFDYTPTFTIKFRNEEGTVEKI
jgi:triacylglycerol lipase